MTRPCLFLLFIPLLFGLNSCTDQESKKIERWETHNGALRIRVTSYPGPGLFLRSNAYYVFEASTLNGEWKEIATVNYDVAEPIDPRSVGFVNDEVAYVNMRWMYAVTTNAGKTWNIWDSRDHQYLDDALEWGAIGSVAVSADGTGEMRLQVFPSPDMCQTLTTRDFGTTWGNGRLVSC